MVSLTNEIPNPFHGPEFLEDLLLFDTESASHLEDLTIEYFEPRSARILEERRKIHGKQHSWWDRLLRRGMKVGAFGLDLSSLLLPNVTTSDSPCSSTKGKASSGKIQLRDSLELTTHEDDSTSSRFICENTNVHIRNSVTLERKFSADPDLKRLQELYFPNALSRFLMRVDYPRYFRAWDWDNMCSSMYNRGVWHGGWHRTGSERREYLEEILPPPLSAKERAMIEQFRRDGFVRVEHWDRESLPDPREEDNFQQLFNDVYDDKLFEGLSSQGRVMLSPLLDRKDSLLRKLVHGYLRSHDVRFTGLQLHKLEGGDEAPSYAAYQNGPWHWDGCGTRVKAWVFMTDVPSDRTGLQTRIVRGSHKKLWWESTQTFEGRKLDKRRQKMQTGPLGRFKSKKVEDEIRRNQKSSSRNMNSNGESHALTPLPFSSEGAPAEHTENIEGVDEDFRDVHYMHGRR